MTTASSPDQPGKDQRTLLKEFVADARLQGLTSRTVGSYESCLNDFIGWLDGDVCDVKKDALREYLAHLKHERQARDGSTGLTPNTLNNYFSALNSFYSFLAYEGYVPGNPVPAFRERYLDNGRVEPQAERQLISVEEMSMLVHSILNVRDRALVTLLAKTGIRRNELIQIDLADIDWEEQSIRLKPTAKRSNSVVFFDGECARMLQRWLAAREQSEVDTDALFSNQYGGRLKRNGVYSVVTKYAEAVGLHDPDTDALEDRFTPHCCRHWFTTYLRRAGMKRAFIQELRGDTRGDAIDIYDHIDRDELRRAYIAHIPSLGI